MKKFLAVLLTGALAVGVLGGCGGKGADDKVIKVAASSTPHAELLEQAGMEFITMYKACTKEPVTAKTERIYFIAREKHQKGKLYVK